MLDLCYNFYHPGCFSLIQNKKAVGHHSAKDNSHINAFLELKSRASAGVLLRANMAKVCN